MSETKNIFAAFVKAQAAFGPALKTSTNPHFKSKFCGLDGCIEAVIDALNQNGIGLVQKTHKDETGVTVETLFIHSSGESLSGGELHVPSAKADPQGFGSALTYARRYSLMAACGIAPEDDDGEAGSGRPGQQNQQRQQSPIAAKISTTTLKAIQGFLDDKETKAVVDRGLAHFKANKPEDLAEADAQAILKKVTTEVLSKRTP